MKLSYLVVFVFFGLVACSTDPPAPSAEAKSQPKSEPQTATIPYTVAGNYTKSGRNWRIVVVQGPIPDRELIELAKQLHRTYAGDSVDIFDDSAQVKEYENWAKNYPSKAHPYPEKWVQKHHLGMINRMLAPGGATWQLLGGTAHPTSPETRIVDL